MWAPWLGGEGELEGAMDRADDILCSNEPPGLRRSDYDWNLEHVGEDNDRRNGWHANCLLPWAAIVDEVWFFIDVPVHLVPSNIAVLQFWHDHRDNWRHSVFLWKWIGGSPGKRRRVLRI